jgi:hypothetical protein
MKYYRLTVTAKAIPNHQEKLYVTSKKLEDFNEFSMLSKLTRVKTEEIDMNTYFGEYIDLLKHGISLIEEGKIPESMTVPMKRSLAELILDAMDNHHPDEFSEEVRDKIILTAIELAGEEEIEEDDIPEEVTSLA